MSEARRARRKEKRCIKRQEKARERAGALRGLSTDRGNGDTRPRPAEGTDPMTRARAGTQTAVSTPTRNGEVQPPPPRRGARIADVPAPSGDWQVVKRGRDGGANRESRPTDPRSYAEAAARASAPSTGARGRGSTTVAGGRGV